MKQINGPIETYIPKGAPIQISDRNSRLVGEISAISRVSLQRCYHCLTCTNGCPFTAAMDVPPNGVIRLVQLGREAEVLACQTIWTCVGCNTCSSACPMAIDMAAVMDALRQRALAQGVAPAQPDVLAFHQAVLGSIERYGRTHKLDVMLRLKLHKRDWLKDVNVGLRMLQKRKLDLKPSRVERIQDVRRLFRAGRREWPHG